MTATELKDLLERVQAWPEEAQNELVSIATRIESELRGDEYAATQDELQVIDAAMASLDAGEFYRVRSDTVQILHIRHTSRRPVINANPT
jgi:hypothetical protein